MIAVSPDGRDMVIASRVRDVLVRVAIDTQTGRLTGLGDTPAGRPPRRFAFCGPSLVALAEQDQRRVTSFRFDPNNGSLASTGHSLDLPSPCVICPTGAKHLKRSVHTMRS